jgi:carbonic anhydrase/acetyltransferase-like protein (isoleucine patch superfamily)
MIKKFLQKTIFCTPKKFIIFVGARNNILDPARLAVQCGYTVLGILDQYFYGNRADISGIPIIGDERWLEHKDHCQRYGWPDNTEFIVTSWWDGKEFYADQPGLNNELVRAQRCLLLNNHWIKKATLIHSSVSLIPDQPIGKGVIIMGQTTISSGVNIGDHCHIEWGSLIVESRLGSNVIVGGKSIIAHCCVGNNVRIGINCTVDPGYNKDGSPGKIGENSVIHMGAVVPRSVPSNHFFSWHGKCLPRTQGNV